MLLVFGRGSLLDGTMDVSCRHDDCDDGIMMLRLVRIPSLSFLMFPLLLLLTPLQDVMVMSYVVVVPVVSSTKCLP